MQEARGLRALASARFCGDFKASYSGLSHSLFLPRSPIAILIAQSFSLLLEYIARRWYQPPELRGYSLDAVRFLCAEELPPWPYGWRSEAHVSGALRSYR